MDKIKKYYFELVILFIAIIGLFIKYEYLFLLTLIIFSLFVTHFILKLKKDIIIIRYKNSKQFTFFIIKSLAEKGFYTSFILIINRLLFNLFSIAPIPFNHFLLFVLYFSFLFSLSLFILLYKINYKKTLFILLLSIISIYSINPSILFSHILINDIYWLNTLYLVASCSLWGIFLIIFTLLNYYLGVSL